MLIPASRLDTSPPVYLVDGMLPDFGVGFGYGGSYTGKSLTLGVELCLAIANGVPFFGRETVQGSAVWCLGEGVADAGVRIKARLVREQADRLAQAAAQDDPDAWLAAQPPYTDDRMFAQIGGFQVPFTAGNEPSRELQQAATRLGMVPDLRLVVLDTAQNFSSLSLSNDTSANRFMLGMSWLADQLQCTVLAVAHPVSKAGSQVGLPGNRLFGASDFVWRVQAGDDSTGDAPSAQIIAEKVKSGPLFPVIGYTLERIQWRQPDTDPETGEDIPGTEVTVRSVTVRQAEDTPDGPDLTLAPVPGRSSLPAAEPVPSSRPRRRNGIRPAVRFRPVSQPPSAAPPEPGPAPGDAAPDPEHVGAALMSVPCGDCAEGAAGRSCNPGVRAGGLVVIGHKPLRVVHVSRLGEAIRGGHADVDDVLACFPDGTAALPVAVPA